MSFGVRLLGFANVMDALGDLQTNIDDSGVYITGTNVSYSLFVEMGTSNMAAQPYLLPAAREAERKAPTIARDAQSVDEALKRIALFIEREAARRAPVDTGNLQASIRTVKVR